jgi:hypothetical protein
LYVRLGRYLQPLRESKSLKDLTRNPFMLRLFVEALPTLKAQDPHLSRITRYGPLVTG